MVAVLACCANCHSQESVALPTEANGQGRAAAMSRDRAPCFLGVLDPDRDPLATNSFSLQKFPRL